ncbi:endo-1,4-beta-xylanase 1-like [Gigantopelta aegis]|uniref:endo-1,4-beta-xylanase 1-like n=1 Tax=Gigantopelta aegis TaxID=1735272 RepID=UPI001B8887D8|nr:endo-1,4-beta-xylanase 1-like [Gigantopelta aegis]
MWSLVVFLGLVSRGLTQEVLENADMESMTGWFCRRASCSLTDTKHGGNHAILASQRTSLKRGPAQRITVELGKAYTISAWVKLVNDQPGKLSQSFRMSVLQKFEDKSRKRYHVASNKRITVADGWVQLKGFVLFAERSAAIKTTEFYINGPSESVDFITDDASVQPLAEWTNWLQDSNDNINQLRKSSINIQVSAAGNVDKSAVEISIKQLKKSFPFGTAIGCDMYHHGDVNYQNFINDHFNWAVTENALKWNLMEKVQGQPRYDRVINALEKLKQNGIKTRGHNILWATGGHVPSWVLPLWGDELRAVVDTRITNVVTKTKELLDHWDVNNENLHGAFYEDHTNDINYDLEIFKKAHDTAPDVKMFLNDYAVVRDSGDMTGAYLTQALRYKKEGVGLYGMGAQSHFNGGSMPSPTIIKVCY